MSRETIERQVVRCNGCGVLLGEEEYAEGLFTAPIGASPSDYDYPTDMGWLIDAPGDWCARCKVYDEAADEHRPPSPEGAVEDGQP